MSVAETGSKLITDLEREVGSWSVEFETAYSSHTSWLSEAIKAGESRILDVMAKPRKKAKVEKENSHPNKVSDVSEDGFGVKKRGSREANREEARPALDVWSLKVADLRRELRSRNLDTKGLKLILQQRLAEALESEADLESHDDEASPNNVAAVEENIEPPNTKFPSSGSASHPQDMEIDVVGSTEVHDDGKGHSKLSEGPGADSPSSHADGVVEIEMEDVSAANAANPPPENGTEEAQGRTSFAASVTNEMSQLSVDHEDHNLDSVLGPVADAANPSAEGKVFDDQKPSIRPETQGTNEAISEDADGPSSLTSKKKKTLGNVLKATAKIFSPKRGSAKAKSTKFESSDVNTEVNQTADKGKDCGRAVGATSQSEKDITGDRIFDEKDLPSNKITQQKSVVHSAKMPAVSSQTNLTTPHHKDPHLSSLSTSQGVANAKPTKPNDIAAKPATTKMSTSSISSGTSSSSSNSSASHSSSASRRVEEMRRKAERMKSEQRSGKHVPSKKNVPSSASNNTASYKALEDKKRANEARKDQQRAHLAKLRGEMREQAKTNIKKGSSAVAQKATALAPNHTITSATATTKVQGNELRGQGATETSTSRTRGEELSRTGVAPAPSTATQDKKKLLAAKMREKAAAQTQKRIAAETENRKAAAPTVTATTQPTKKSAPLAASKQAPSFAKQQQDTMVLKLQEEHHLRQQQQQQGEQQQLQKKQQQQQLQKKQQQQQNAKAPSPMDTYEMSEKEDTDSSEEESDSDDQSQPRKRVPTWAQKPNLMNALEKQFSLNNPQRIDPDAVFGEVHTCDLEEIFDQKKSRYARRTSSGNWTQDKVTVMEKLTYKRTMGFESPP